MAPHENCLDLFCLLVWCGLGCLLARCVHVTNLKRQAFAAALKVWNEVKAVAAL